MVYAMSPYQFAKKQIQAGKFPAMGYTTIAGATYLTADDNILPGGKAYPTREAAIADRSKILDRAHRALNK